MGIRKRTLLGVVIVTLFAGGAVAQPRIEFPQGDTHDFGNIYKGKDATHIFVIKNTGTDSLVISKVTPGCGCTAALLSSSRIPPNSTAELKVTFSSGVFLGPVSKPITVSSNDPNKPTATIHIVSNVVQVLQFDPGTLSFVGLKADSLVVRTVKVRNLIDKPIRILSLVDAESKGIGLKVGKKVLNPGDSTNLYASYTPSPIEGWTGGRVIVKTDFGPQPDQFLQVVIGQNKK